MMAKKRKFRRSSLNPTTETVMIHVMGMIVVWSLIFLSPLGEGFSPETIGLGSTLFDFRAGLSALIWQVFGYRYSLASGVQCSANTDALLVTLVYGLWGAGIGVVGAYFQILAMKTHFTSIHRQTMRRLMLTWGIILFVLFTALASGALMWEQISGLCFTYTYFTSIVTFIASMYLILVFPFLISIAIGVFITLWCWRTENYANFTESVTA